MPFSFSKRKCVSLAVEELKQLLARLKFYVDFVFCGWQWKATDGSHIDVAALETCEK